MTAALPVGAARRTVVCLWLALAALPAAAQEPGRVGGRVVDEQTGDPVEGAQASIPGIDPVLTDASGAFLLDAVPEGLHVLSVDHLAYGSHTREIAVEAGRDLALRVTISTRAIELSPLLVETLSELELRRQTSGYSINELRRPEIDRAERAGFNLAQLLQGSMPGVMVRQGFGSQMCVTYRAIRSDNDRGDCDGVAVVLDGVPIADPAYIYTSIPLGDIERLEMLSPGQGGVRYGMRSGQSVLLIETKTAAAARRDDLDRLITGLDWSQETEPYDWPKVFGSALVVNAIGVGVGLALADRCFWTPESASFALRTRCRAAETAGTSVVSVVLPAVAGSLAVQWGGRTERSQGRLVPTMVLSGLVLTGGYLTLIGSESDAQRTAGVLVLSVGVPLTMTFSDRIFRVLR